MGKLDEARMSFGTMISKICRGGRSNAIAIASEVGPTMLNIDVKKAYQGWFVLLAN